MSAREAVICEPVRTPIGRYGGMFKSQNAVELGVAALTGLLDRTGVPPEAVQESSSGTATQTARRRRSGALSRWIPGCR